MHSVNDVSVNEYLNGEPESGIAQRFAPEDYSVLVVDDDLDQLHFMGALVGESGYSVYIATSAQECLQIIEEFPVDVIVSDIMMPDTDGLNFVKHLRALHLHQLKEQLPVILVSADRDDLEYQAVVEGADMYCSKRQLRKLLLTQIRLLLD